MQTAQQLCIQDVLATRKQSVPHNCTKTRGCYLHLQGVPLGDQVNEALCALQHEVRSASAQARQTRQRAVVLTEVEFGARLRRSVAQGIQRAVGRQLQLLVCGGLQLRVLLWQGSPRDCV